MTPFCPHCAAELSTYTTIVDREPTNIEVLVCARCDKVLGVVGLVGPARDEGRRVDVHEIADLLDVAVSADDDGEALTVFTVAIDKINSEIEGGGDSALSGEQIELLLRMLVERIRERDREQAKRRPQRPQ